MPHIDPEQLALLALGEPPVVAGTRDHLADCATCRDGLRHLRAVVDLGREEGPDAGVAPPPPPRRVWDRIAAQLAPEPSDTLTEDAPGLPPSVVTVVAAPPVAPPGAASAARHGAPAERIGARVVRLDARPSRRWSVLATAAACVVGLAVGVAATLGFTTRSDRTEPTAPRQSATVLASARLTAVGTAADAIGTARVVRAGDRVELDIDTRNLPPVDGYYEAWMYVPDTQKMQSMGAVEPGTVTRFRVPDGLEVAVWAGVNISAEPLDGNPNHSARSVLDGELHG